MLMCSMMLMQTMRCIACISFMLLYTICYDVLDFIASLDSRNVHENHMFGMRKALLCVVMRFQVGVSLGEGSVGYGGMRWDSRLAL